MGDGTYKVEEDNIAHPEQAEKVDDKYKERPHIYLHLY